ncbi:MAG: FAD:protein FMN transferase, partial [candidate division WOR-3 bacterium]
MKRTRDLLLCCLLLAGCQSTVSERRTMLLMDTYVTIQALGPRSVIHRAVELSFKRLAEIDRRFNHLDSTSPVFAFNTKNVPLEDSEVISVLEVARDLSIASGGVFDVTVEPLVRLWGFYNHKMAVPTQRAIDSCLKL